MTQFQDLSREGFWLAKSLKYKDTKYRRAPAEAGGLQGKRGLPHHHLVQGPPAETATHRSQKTGNRQACSDQGHKVTFSEMTVTHAGKEVKESTRETSGLL